MKRHPDHTAEERKAIRDRVKGVVAEHLDDDQERSDWLTEIIVRQAFVPWPVMDQEDERALSELLVAVKKISYIMQERLSSFAFERLDEVVWKAGGSRRQFEKQIERVQRGLGAMPKAKDDPKIMHRPDGKLDPFKLQVVSAARRGWYFAFEERHPPRALNEESPFALYLSAVLVAFGLRSPDDETGVRSVLKNWAEHSGFDPSDTDEPGEDYELTPEEEARFRAKYTDEGEIS